jgi:hypothetical protein
MKRTTLALSLLVLAAACSPPAPNEAKVEDVASTTPSGAEAAGCFAEAAHDWSAVGGQYYVVDAEARGATCREATATIRISSRQGAVLLTQSYPTAQVSLAFNPNGDQTGLRNELEEWIVNTANPATANTLPAWPSGAAKPPGFQPAQGVTRNTYEGARGAQGPLFCYPDGGESNACVAMAGDRATLLGSLTPERP